MDDFRYDNFPYDEFDDPAEDAPEQEPEQKRPARKRKKKKTFFGRLLRLPPRLLLAALALLVIIIVVVIAVARSCSALPENPIRAQAFSTKTELLLPVEATLNEGDFLAYGGYQFETKKSLSAMEKLVLKHNENVTSATYGNAAGSCCVFTRQNEFGKDSWCLYQKDPNLAKNLFVFMGMHRDVGLEDGSYSILLPLHLISDSSLRDNMGAQLELGKTYTCGLDQFEEGQTIAGLFQGFYEESGLYVVLSNPVGFTMYPKTDSTRELIFSFDEAGGVGKFLITVPVEPEPEPSASALVQYLGSENTDPVTLPERDSLRLSELLMNLTFQPGESPEDVAEYLVEANDSLYSITKSWQNDTWSVRVEDGEGGSAKLNAKDSCTVMAIIGANLEAGTPTRDIAGWAGDVDTNFSYSASHMVTTADVNVRSVPATNGSQVLMTMPQSSSVAVIARNAAGWCEIWYNNRLAYMKVDYLKTVE